MEWNFLRPGSRGGLPTHKLYSAILAFLFISKPYFFFSIKRRTFIKLNLKLKLLDLFILLLVLKLKLLVLKLKLLVLFILFRFILFQYILFCSMYDFSGLHIS